MKPKPKPMTDRDYTIMALGICFIIELSAVVAVMTKFGWFAGFLVAAYGFVCAVRSTLLKQLKPK